MTSMAKFVSHDLAIEDYTYRLKAFLDHNTHGLRLEKDCAITLGIM